MRKLAVTLGFISSVAAEALPQSAGLNVIFNEPPTAQTFAILQSCCQVRDVIPQLNAVMVHASASQCASIAALPFVASVSADVACDFAAIDPLPISDFTAGANSWTLDAINVTDVGGGRTVGYDGDGVYVAVIDTGLPHNWRAYFPEQRIATQFARGFIGGGGQAHVVSSQPNAWEHDTAGHGTSIVSVILGFAYAESLPLPVYFNGVAPKATIIPIKVGFDASGYLSGHWESAISRAIVYAADLKASGALGGAPLIINLSSGDPHFQEVPLERAAIDYALAHGVIVVVCAGNEAQLGMRYPGAYPEVISVGATTWTGAFPTNDPTGVAWILNDVAENDLSQLPMAPFSAHPLPGQYLDVVAPGFPVPVPWTVNGSIDYTFTGGTSQATPHVVGVAALMLQKNPHLTQVQIESILKSTALPMGAGCAQVPWPSITPGDPPTFEDHKNVSIFPLTTCWPASATGAGLIQADLALAATPWL